MVPSGENAGETTTQLEVEPAADTDRNARPWWRRPATIVAAGVLGGLAVLYGLDVALTAGEVPRGTLVGGVSIGGLTPAGAEQTLREAITPRLSKPVQIVVDGRETTFVPNTAGVTVDFAASVTQAGTPPANPWTRFTSLFSGESFPVVARGDDKALTATIDKLRTGVDRALVEGNIHFDGLTPVPVLPQEGRRLNPAASRQALLSGWASADRLELPVETVRPKATPESVQAAVEQVAGPAVSGPATVRGDGRESTVSASNIAEALTFTPSEDGKLVPSLDKAKLGQLAEQLAPTEKPGQDARMAFEGDLPQVVPASDGRVVDWDKTLPALLKAISKDGNRAAGAEYRNTQAQVTTEEIAKLGIKEVVGEFTTRGFARDSGINIRVVAEKVNGAIVKPGSTFSLNDYTGPRGRAQGYVEAGVIEEGVPARAVGGGISQFATTLYNASYFAGMTDDGHKEHSFHISRYPAAREATVFQNPDGSSVIDLKFKNDAPTGVAIQTIWTNSSITVRLWGTKHVTVESIPGPKHGYTSPPTVTKSAGSCRPAKGKSGFTTSDTRVIRDLNGAEISRTTRTVRYEPEPAIVCSGSD